MLGSIQRFNFSGYSGFFSPIGYAGCPLVTQGVHWLRRVLRRENPIGYAGFSIGYAGFFGFSNKEFYYKICYVLLVGFYRRVRWGS